MPRGAYVGIAAALAARGEPARKIPMQTGLSLMFRKLAFTAALVTAAMVSTAQAEEYKLGDLVIDTPWMKATMPNAPVSGGYMVIRNTGSEADRLIGGNVDFAGKVEVHEMKMENDVMKMREVEGGLEIPAGGEVVLKPGGFHVMFMGLKEQLKEGETREVEVSFQNAGSITLPFPVKPVTMMKKPMAQGAN